MRSDVDEIPYGSERLVVVTPGSAAWRTLVVDHNAYMRVRDRLRLTHDGRIVGDPVSLARYPASLVFAGQFDSEGRQSRISPRSVVLGEVRWEDYRFESRCDWNLYNDEYLGIPPSR